MNYEYEEYIKQLNKSHILPNILNGAKSGITSQFIADIILSFLILNENTIVEDIKISGIASYYASVASGMMASFLATFMDTYALTIISSITYVYVFELAELIIYNNEIELDSEDIILDVSASLLLIYAFDPVAHNQYLRFKEKKKHILPEHHRMDRTVSQNIFIIVLVNTYTFFTDFNEKNLGKTNENS